MSTHNILFRVYDSSGRPKCGVRVVLDIFQFLAWGQKEATTNGSGEAEFNLDLDDGAQISASIDGGRAKVAKGPIRGSYRVQL